MFCVQRVTVHRVRKGTSTKVRRSAVRTFFIKCKRVFKQPVLLRGVDLAYTQSVSGLPWVVDITDDKDLNIYQYDTEDHLINTKVTKHKPNSHETLCVYLWRFKPLL